MLYTCIQPFAPFFVHTDHSSGLWEELTLGAAATQDEYLVNSPFKHADFRRVPADEDESVAESAPDTDTEIISTQEPASIQIY